MNNEVIVSIIDLSFNVSIAFLGIGFTLFTLLYAFIQNKKDALKDVEEILNTEGGSMTILRKRNSATKFIANMRKINIDAIIIIISSFICLAITSVLKILDIKVPYVWTWVILIFISLYFLTIIWSLIRAFVRIMKAYRTSK